MLDGKNGENIVGFGLVPKDVDFPCDGVLLVCRQLDGDCGVVKATKLVQQGNRCLSWQRFQSVSGHIHI